MFSNIVSQVKAKMSELKDEAKKFKSKDFLSAALGGSALVTMADGTIDKAEKTKMMSFIQNHDVLSIYETAEVVKIWKDYIDTLEMDADIGEAKAMQALGKMKGKDQESRLIIRLVIAIGSADGDFDQDEQRIAARICRELGIDPAEFELS